jgi:hypothetical protein
MRQAVLELIPPVHRRVCRMGLEHLGIVVREEIDEFSRVHRAALTGQHFQSPGVEPVYGLFEGFSHGERLGATAAGHRHRPQPAPAPTLRRQHRPLREYSDLFLELLLEAIDHVVDPTHLSEPQSLEG